MSEEEKEKIPNLSELLLNPKLIDDFLQMFNSQLEALADEGIRIEKIRESNEKTVNLLEEKRAILTKYKQFVDHKGFGYTKQQADSYFEEIAEAEKARIPEPENIPEDSEHFNIEICSQPYPFYGVILNCTRPRGHDGGCGSI